MGHSMKKILLIVGAVFVIPPVLFVASLVFYMATSDGESLDEARRRAAEGPASAEDVFDNANRLITSSGDGHAYGNNEAAIVMADQYSGMT
jgi:hypothetical protein